MPLKGLASFSGHICVPFTRRKVFFLSLHDFVRDRVLFSLNKDFFRYCEKTSFGEKKIFFFFFFFFFLEIPVFLRIFWSGVVRAFDIFVAEHVANI